MASFSASMTVAGTFTIDLNAFTLEMYQQVDSLGRPASPTHGGQMTVTFNTTSHALITGWMINPAQQYSGSITFLDLEGRTLKTIDFVNAHCVDQNERFDGTDSSMQMETTIVIAPERIMIGHLPHDNDWPPTEAV